jgi:twinkle protein
MTPIEFAAKYFKHYRIKSNEIIPVYCPYCNGGRNKDKFTFAMNVETGAFNCKRGSCNVTGTFYRLKLDFGEVSITETKAYKATRKQFKKSTAKVNPIGINAADKVMQYIKLRGISEDTCMMYGVGDDGKGNIAFPYYKNNVQVAVKYRHARKLKPGERKMWREEGTDTETLFGMHLVDGDTLVITEGEFDAMALYEAGIRNVVSVPNGSEDTNWIEANFDWLESFKVIYLCGDNDEAGQNMIRTITPRLGEWRTKIVKLPGNCKDANEVLVKHGKQAITQAFDRAEFVPVEALVRMADVKQFDIDKVDKVASGIRGLDRKAGGFMMGQVSVWTGENGSGKSTLLGQLLIESIHNDFNVCAFSGELPNPLFRYWIELQMAGPKNLKHKYDNVLEGDRYYVDNETATKMRAWYYDKFFLYDSTSAIDIDSVMRVFTTAARRHNCKVFLVDNLMMLIGGTDDYYLRQSEFMKRLTTFAKKFDVHVHLVAHPRKTTSKVGKMDVGGSGDITNLADNVFVITRVKDADKDKPESFGCDALLEILKTRFTGRIEYTVGLKFHEASKRFYMPSDEELLNRRYGWEDKEVMEYIPWWTEIDEDCPF